MGVGVPLRLWGAQQPPAVALRRAEFPALAAGRGRGGNEDVGGAHSRGSRRLSAPCACPRRTRRAEPPRTGFYGVSLRGRSRRRAGLFKGSPGPASRGAGCPRFTASNFAESFLPSGRCSRCCFHQQWVVGLAFFFFSVVLLFVFSRYVYWHRLLISR